MRTLFAVLSMIAVFATVPGLDAKDEQKGNGKQKAKQESARQADRNRTTKDPDADFLGWARRTEGHRPQDLNGDGLITRNEWPGNDVSFRRLDRNGDGVISEYDRSLRPNTSTVHGSGDKKR